MLKFLILKRINVVAQKAIYNNMNMTFHSYIKNACVHNIAQCIQRTFVSETITNLTRVWTGIKDKSSDRQVLELVCVNFGFCLI